MAKRKVASTGSRRGNAEQREAHWREVLAAWETSGLTQAAFCREHELSAKTFTWWKRELGRRDAARASSRRSTRSRDASRTGTAVFLPLRVAGAGEAPRVGDGGLEVLLVSGRRVRVGSDVDVELLTKVVTVLEGVPW
jgi:transposase